MFFLVIFVIVVVIFSVILRMLVIIVIIIPGTRRFPAATGKIGRFRETVGRYRTIIHRCLSTYRVPLPLPIDCSKLSSTKPTKSRLAVSLTTFSRF